MKPQAVALIALAVLASAARAAQLGGSVLTGRLDDPAAAYVENGASGVRGDGRGDDANAIQKAIDSLQEMRGQGVVFLAEGRYRIARTINLWKGIRLAGFGAARPVLVAPADSPAFRSGVERYMIHFRDARPRAGGKLGDAGGTTFASGILNVDFEVQQGSGLLAAVRYHVAQLCTIRDCDFRLADDVEAGVHAIGNEIFRCRFLGGRHGIATGATAAGWQSLVMDCLFERQRIAAVQTARCGLTVLGCTFRDVPAGIVVPPKEFERLYVENSLFETVPGGAIVSDDDSRPVHQINLVGVACRDVPELLRLRPPPEGNPPGPPAGAMPAPPGRTYFVRRLSRGLLVEEAGAGARPRHGTLADLAARDAFAPAELPRPLPALPPSERWVNVRSLGAGGDGKSDDTAALDKAVAGHDVLYLPAGRYVLRRPLELKAATMLIGLHPRATQLVLADGSAGFADPNHPRAILAAPPGGRNVVLGVGFACGKDNPASVPLKWQAGPDARADDLNIPYGAGGGQVYGLWVAEGGGGTIKNLWAPNDAARCGLYVSRTETPGRAVLCSIEHHKDVEVVLDKVRNWTFHALQTEAESNGWSTAVEMTDCRDVTFTNLYLYRTSRTKRPHPHAIRAAACRDVILRGVHNFSLSPLPYAATLVDADTAAAVAAREAAYVALRPR